MELLEYQQNRDSKMGMDTRDKGDWAGQPRATIKDIYLHPTVSGSEDSLPVLSSTK